MQEPAANSPPSLVVGFKGDGDISIAMKEAGAVAADTAQPGTPVDFVEIKAGAAGIDAHMLNTVEPFYKRSWGVKVSSFLRGKST